MKELSEAGRPPADGTEAAWWREHLRTDDLSIGTYVIPAGGEDPQEPHTEDEVYVVSSGRAVSRDPTARSPSDRARSSSWPPARSIASNGSRRTSS